MKLQVKDSGAWRNVLTFEPERRADVEAASAALLRAAVCSKSTLRICAGETVLARCEPPACAWRPA
jgi:hypothetical protein